MLIAIISMVVATVIIIGFLFRPKPPIRVVVFDRTPDRPVSFSADGLSWLAVRAHDPDQVVRALDLEQVEPANWTSGVAALSDRGLRQRHVFAAPRVDGWILIAGDSLPLPPPSDAFEDTWTPLLERLAQTFLEAQFFAIHPDQDIYAWARAAHGRIERAYVFMDGRRTVDIGDARRDERALGLARFELRGVSDRHGDVGGQLLFSPTRSHVLTLAGRWSIDPTRLSSRLALTSGCGLVGQAPCQWIRHIGTGRKGLDIGLASHAPRPTQAA